MPTIKGLSRALEKIVTGKDRTVELLLDRHNLVDDTLVRRLVAQATLRWAGRTPSPAINTKGQLIGTNLDLASVLVGLAQRRAVIHIQQYERRRPKRDQVRVRRIGTTSFGHLERLVGNKDTFSFSALLHDHSVIASDREGREHIGAPRTYMILDIDGSWHSGWKDFAFLPSTAEMQFFTDRRVVAKGGLHFKHFVHPNRYQSIFGAPYLRLKLLLSRLEDEAAYLREEQQRFQKGTKKKSPVSSREKTEAGAPMVIPAFEVALETPPFRGSYFSRVATEEHDAYAPFVVERYRTIVGTWIPLVRFVVRADELAYYRFGYDKDKKPAWAWKLTTERNVKIPKSRARWNQVRFSTDYALRFRAYTRTEVVAL